MDGFLEIWDYDTGKLNMELEYQANDRIMMHNDAVLCISFSDDSQWIASGSRDGMIKVWNISTGKCAKRFDKAHNSSITSIALCHGDQITQVLSGSHDSCARIHGFSSKGLLKQFSAPNMGFVNSVAYGAPDNNIVITGSSDGLVRLWNRESMECSQVISLTESHPKIGAPTQTIHQVVLIQGSPNPIQSGASLLVCNASPALHLVTLSTGDHHRTQQSQQSLQVHGDFVACAVSPMHQMAFGVTEQGTLCCFQMHEFKKSVGTCDETAEPCSESSTMQLVSAVNIRQQQLQKKKSGSLVEQVPDGGTILAMAHHPSRSLLVICSDKGTANLFI